MKTVLCVVAHGRFTYTVNLEKVFRYKLREAIEGIDMDIKAVIFDLDGTLADTAPDIAQALNLALNDAGLVQIQLKSVIGMIGGGIPRLVRRALLYLDTGEDLVEEVVASMQAHYRKNYCDKSLLMDGVEDCLKGLKDR